jgi:hypothetical protein
MPITPIRERAKPELWVEKESPDENWLSIDEADEERGEQIKITRTLVKALEIRLVSFLLLLLQV